MCSAKMSNDHYTSIHQHHDISYQPDLSINDDVNSTEQDETSQLLKSSPANGAPTAYTQLSNFPDPQDLEVSVEYSLTRGHSQHSIITIFSMWNTMMGTSLLCLPWALKQAGFITGISLLVLVAGIMAYTSYRVLSASKSMAGYLVEFSDVVKAYLGRVAEFLTLVCSLLTLLGGCIVFWILMSNFLYHIGMFIYSHSIGTQSLDPRLLLLARGESNVLCSNMTDVATNETSTFEKVWSETHTIPLYLALVLFPLISLKSPTFFTKFNSLGTISVIYLIIFVTVKASEWGMNFDMVHSDSISYSPAFEYSFPALTGVAALAYFLQNCVVAITSNQKNEENNTRDLIIAYVLVCLTYVYIGAMFYAAFPLSKSCIEDNFLNNIASMDIMAFIARIFLLFQMFSVLPLFTYVIRSQLLSFLFKSVWPSAKHVLLLNAIIVGVCLVFAALLPTIGHIISFVGALCGFSYGVFLPCLVYLVMCHHNGTLSAWKIGFHGLLIALGFANFVAQFIIIGHTKA